METGIELNLSGINGNVFSIIGAAHKALRKAGKADLFEQFEREATSGDYDHVIQTCMKWFEVS